MSEIAIQVEGVSKLYRIGQRETYRTLREVLTEAAQKPFRRLSASTRQTALQDDRDRPANGGKIWALKDISLEIQRGDAVGIIGRNGAGKSTLLKILSRITRPTAGCAEIRGRVGSLLEVGTGFHPELTGRENIFLNGAILGMSKVEILRKFDEIVSFAEIEKFIDTPVKRYSSGMFMRLAFSVAAHLEPEIMLVDEVLAVGDAAFQQKCLRVMGQMGSEGRTVLFVSHNLAAVEALCKKCFLFERGSLIASGPTHQIVGQYLDENAPAPSQLIDLSNHPGRLAGATPVMQQAVLKFQSNHGSEQSSFTTGGDLTLTVSYMFNRPIAKPVLGLVIKNRFGVNILGLNNKFFGAYPSSGEQTSGKITCQLNGCPLSEGRYIIDLWFGDTYQDYDVIENAVSFDVVLSRDLFGTGLKPGSELGVIIWPAEWHFEADEKQKNGDA